MPSLRLSKWGNSVGIRIPTEYLRLTGMKAGDHLEANFDADGALTLRSVAFSRKAFALELTAQQHDTPMGESVIAALRQGARY